MLIRVLHVVTSMNAGGIETMLMNLYRAIDRTKIQFDFLVHRSSPGFYDEEILKLGGRIFYIMPLTPVNLFNYYKKLTNILENNPELNIIHSHINSYSCFPLYVAKLNKIKVRIAQSHQYHKSFRTIPAYRVPIILICNIFIKYQYTHAFACSELAGRWLFGNDVNFKIINNAIDADKFIFNINYVAKMKNELNLHDKFVVGHIGNFSNAKNYPFIIEVFSNIYKTNNNARLILVGNNKKNPDIERRINEIGLQEAVIFTGVRSDIPELLFAMDVFLFPSHNEGLPVTIIEAQASGLKCFLSDSITTEVAITDLVEFKSLKQSAAEWANSIMPYAYGYERKDMSKQIVEAGYDIKENAHWLQNFYINAIS